MPSYTPPSGDSIQFRFDGSEYAAPDGNAIHFSFAPPPRTGSVFVSVVIVAEGEGSAYYRVTGFIECDLPINTEATGAAYAYGQGAVTLSPVVDGAALAFPVGAATVASLFAVAAVGSVEVSGGITTFILPTIDASGIYTRPVLIAPAVSAEGARGVGGSAMITLPVAVQASACRGVRGTADIGVEFNGYAAGGIGPFGQGSALLSPRVAATGGTTRMSFGSASIEIPVNIAACGETTGSVHIQTNSLFVVTRDEVVHVRHG